MDDQTMKKRLAQSEETRLLAQRRLAELGFGDPASRAQLDPVRLRETLPPLPDITQMIREQREERAKRISHS